MFSKPILCAVLRARNSKQLFQNLALQAFFIDIVLLVFTTFTEDGQGDGYFCVRVLCFFITVTFAACSTLSSDCRKKKYSFEIDHKLLIYAVPCLATYSHVNHGSCGLDRFNEHVTSLLHRHTKRYGSLYFDTAQTDCMKWLISAVRYSTHSTLKKDHIKLLKIDF